MAKSIGDRMMTFIKYALVLLGVIFIVLIFFLIREATSLERSQMISERKAEFSNFLSAHHGPMTIGDVGIIAPWMTFDYINKLFKLPPDYLKTSLNISSSKYPQISISGYAKSDGVAKTIIVSEVQAALRNYFNNSTKSQ